MSAIMMTGLCRTSKKLSNEDHVRDGGSLSRPLQPESAAGLAGSATRRRLMTTNRRVALARHSCPCAKTVRFGVAPSL